MTLQIFPISFSSVFFRGIFFYNLPYKQSYPQKRDNFSISFLLICMPYLFTYLFSFIALKRSPVYCWVELVRVRILSLFSVREESFQYFTKYNINTVSHHLLRSSLCSRQTLTWHPKILTSFYSYPCVICFSWVWAGHIDLLLMNRAQQKWWNITLKFRS